MSQLDPVLLDSLQQQITRERQNEAVYLAVAHRFDVLNLTGFAAWSRKAAREEAEHAQRFADYVIDRNAAPQVQPLGGVIPPIPLDMLSAPALLVAVALQTEINNTESIKTLYSLAEEADDPQTCVWLIWAIEEQTSAERELTTLLARCKLAENDAAAVLQLDRELGARHAVSRG